MASDPKLMEWAEDVCEVCGAHVGSGIRLLHLGRCDEHTEEYEYDDDELQCDQCGAAEGECECEIDPEELAAEAAYERWKENRLERGREGE